MDYRKSVVFSLIGLGACLLGSLSLPAQSHSEQLSGNWVTVSATCRNGARAKPLVQRLTLAGEERGTAEMERTLNFDDAKTNVHFKCTGTLKGNFAATDVGGGMKILHITSGVDLAGRDCKNDAGIATKVPDTDFLVNLRGNNLTTVSDGTTECPGDDLLIVVYRRAMNLNSPAARSSGVR